MRLRIFSVLCVCFLYVSAYKVSTNTEKALDAIRQGQIELGVKQLKSAAAVNDITAQFYMGQCYELGLGLNSDAWAAFGMYRRAAERGLPQAMLELARCYRDGIGVSKNEARANEWERRYSNRHDGTSLPNIAEIYNIGINQSGNVAINSDETGSAEISEVKTVSSQPVTISQSNEPIVVHHTSVKPLVDKTKKSDVDMNIPMTHKNSNNVFALIIANENYQDVSTVANALNDGEIMAEYCKKTLGLPSTNIRFIKDATLNNIKREVNLIKQIAIAYKGEASFIVYYAGHGVPDENTRNAFLLPVDGFGSDLTTCYSLADFYNELGDMPSLKTVILLDACFSGAIRGDGMLASARGVAIKSKPGVPRGNTVVISSAQGDETAYPYSEKHHGLFTYFFLKKLQETRGDATLGALIEYVKDNVVKKSLVVNSKSQTPTAIPSQTVDSNWYNWKLN